MMKKDTKCLPDCGYDFKLKPDSRGQIKCPKCGCVNLYKDGNVYHRILAKEADDGKDDAG